MKKVLISLYDLTGNASRPYRENGWTVFQIDIQNGIDVLKWDYTIPLLTNPDCVGIIAMQPCTCYALSGNRHKKKRLENGEFAMSQRLVDRTHEIIGYYGNLGILNFWIVEQPMTDIHKKNPWLGEVRYKFNPCDFAGYDPEPDRSRYNKETWLFGSFRNPEKKRLEPIERDSPIWKNFGGPSINTKNSRSVTPLGFAYAFFHANNKF